jgi:phosphoribosylamine--glycine ligase
MRVLVIGSGGREHALAWKIKQSPLVKEVISAPGNYGLAQIGPRVNIKPEDIEGLVSFALEQEIDLTVVGPELPLAQGIVDRFIKEGLLIFGPSKKASLLEASKVFAKRFMTRHNIPTANYEVFEDLKQAIDYIKSQENALVVKADGLAYGKGVIVCKDSEQAIRAASSMLEGRIFKEAGARIIIEEKLLGKEISFLALTDGEDIISLAVSKDYKPVYDGDKGPNTGGMGAFSPVPYVSESLFKEIEEKIIIPTVLGLKEEGYTFRGVIYAGLMISDARPYVLEFNVRFGDPETQPLMLRLKSDLVPLLVESAQGRFSSKEVEWDSRSSVCVVLASGGYPQAYKKGKEIRGLCDIRDSKEVVVFHAGTKAQGEKVVTAGGRVLGITALGDGLLQASELAYQAVQKIKWEDMHYRTDIGIKF